ncbi:Ras GTPase-activating-like protein IQGAP1 [Oopsacas minuta]|uniref:Ras GTPase-activating-like protein IQGAP1 n=1 Tax=Oopsacas minuta TaxID=111878 RepID=A0AAV7JMU0_9METZ|nr:Ras GTPase-activating-like protein IQGAP1 [Oopsacas minuta]
MISKPVVRLTAKDIISTHKLFVEHATVIAPEKDDVIHEILADLGTDLNLRNLVGDLPDLTTSSSEETREMFQEAGETEIALTLSSKHDQFDINEPTDSKAIFVQTKGMCVDLLRIQPGETLSDVLDTPPSEEIRKKFSDMIQRQIEKGHGDHLLIRRYTTALHTSNPTIDTVKSKIKRNLDILEEDGLVSRQTNYQEIINAIAKDITNQARHRKQRRVEKKRLNKTLTQLNEKESFHEEQYTFYQQYINSALENMAKARNLRGSGASGGAKATNTDFKSKSVKYSAQRLYEKGVILEIEGIQRFQYRSISIEIRQIDASKFEVHAKFLGNLVEKTELIIQDLLQLQFDGVTVCKIGSQVKVNVNLLIFLINKKLYGKLGKK